ncbi:MAG: 50S ribosomal protein L10 [Candidatus Omnitrophica bacterium]|nr:50S ribosomal protein L10 [Candidatus Omnitrophota bacterium]
MKAEKIAAVESLRGKIKEAHFIVFVGFSGVTVTEMTIFRSAVKKAEGAFKVVKNTFFQRVLKGLDFPETDNLIIGPTGIILFSGKDEVSLVKAIYGFNKEKAVPLVFRGGYQNGALISRVQLERLAKLPNREVILSQFCAGVAGPIYQFLFTLKAVPQKFVSVLKQIAEKDN